MPLITGLIKFFSGGLCEWSENLGYGKAQEDNGMGAAVPRDAAIALGLALHAPFEPAAYPGHSNSGMNGNQVKA